VQGGVADFPGDVETEKRLVKARELAAQQPEPAAEPAE
jgi:hypothetical protein